MAPRRLLDLPGIDALEYKALMKPRMADLGAEADFPEIDEAARAAFGLSVTEAGQTARPDGWDGIEDKPLPLQVEQFEAEGWDVTDKRGKPLRMLPLLAAPLWLTLRGVAGALPFQPDTAETDDEAAQLAALKRDAAAFRRERR